MRRDNDRYNGDFRGRNDRDTNFDRMYDAREYGGSYRDDRYRNDGREPNYRRDDRYQGPNYEEYEEEPKKRSFFRSNIARKRDNSRHNIEMQETPMGASQFIVTTPKSFEDIQGVIDNLKAHRALVIDLCRLNASSVQRVMDYVNGAIYALDGSIQCINPATFLLTPTGMGISVPIDYIKDKWERNKKK